MYGVQFGQMIISQKEIDALAMEGHSDLEYECLASIGMPKFNSPKSIAEVRGVRGSQDDCRPWSSSVFVVPRRILYG